jgi:hypothetical protein
MPDLDPRLAKTSEKVQNCGMTTEVQWSELQRDPRSVAALADEGDVRVRRRDGAPLLLIREDRASSATEGAITAARALRNLLAHISAGTVAESLRDEFPWTDYLPENDQAQFATEFARTFQACAELGGWSKLAELVDGWRNTAYIHTDPELVRQLTEPVSGDFGPVPPPMEI